MITRLNKYLADCGVASRRKAEELILQGRISVNGQTVHNLTIKIDSEKDTVEFDGEKLKSKANVYYLLNKPKGIISSTNDEKKRRTVLDLIKSDKRIFPVGRLDYNTTGVLFLTNDGEFSHWLTHPKNNIPRVYEVKLDKPLVEDHRQKLLKGIYIENKMSKFTKIIFPNAGDKKSVELACVEGRNHFVKKMFGVLGYRVNELNRKSFGGIKADIKVGMYRKLTADEVKELYDRYDK
jgi:23S rRNA pseudouridine2605 synthase